MWLENENRIGQICTAREHSNEWHACRESNLQPKVDVIPLLAEPAAAARRLGEIVIVAIPGQGLKAFVGTGGRTSQFTPDLYDSDWGYGPWFHQTVLERRGAWFRLALPTVGAGWADLRTEKSPDNRVQRLDEGDIVVIPDGDVVFLGLDKNILRFRPEQEADMWCEAGQPPALAKWQELRIPVDRLRDPDGRLRLTYKYTRGC